LGQPNELPENVVWVVDVEHQLIDCRVNIVKLANAGRQKLPGDGRETIAVGTNNEGETARRPFGLQAAQGAGRESKRERLHVLCGSARAL
jgi:hypothetical protein